MRCIVRARKRIYMCTRRVSVGIGRPAAAAIERCCDIPCAPQNISALIYESRCIDDAVVLLCIDVFILARVRRKRPILATGSSERRQAMNPDIGSR